ncbi:hypothetical protein HDU98_008175 [Podochytrium sp. JEL0797]|nr:hypothetical protein HDU98_008175 [Podochytrium sp. JEL0797]
MASPSFVHTPRIAAHLQVAPHTRIYYELHGSASAPKKLLFINGSGQSCRMWGLALDRLKRNPAVEVCVFDGRGVGDSEWDRPFSMRDLAEDVVLLLQEAGWTKSRDVWIVGYSMGGMVAQNVVLLEPSGRFSGVALINTTARGWYAVLPSWTTFWGYIQIALGLIPLKTTADIVQWMLGTCFPRGWLDAKPKWTDGWATNRAFMVDYTMRRGVGKTRQTPEGKKAQRGAVWSHGLTAGQLRDVGGRTRVTVFVGRADQMIWPANSDYLAKHTGAKMIEFPACGHALFEQEFEKFHDILENEFLACE